MISTWLSTFFGGTPPETDWSLDFSNPDIGYFPVIPV